MATFESAMARLARTGLVLMPLGTAIGWHLSPLMRRAARQIASQIKDRNCKASLILLMKGTSRIVE